MQTAEVHHILPQGSGAEAANYCIHYSIENKVSSVIRRGSRGGYLELRVKYSEGVGRRGSYIPGGLGGVYTIYGGRGVVDIFIMLPACTACITVQLLWGGYDL